MSSHSHRPVDHGLSLAGRKVLVTGAGGFIGSHLSVALVRAGAEVHAAVRRALPEPIDGVQVHRVDLADLPATRRVFEEIRPHLIFHLAGHVQGSRSLEHVHPALMGNLVTTVNLMTLAAEMGCEGFVLTGSQDEPDGSEIAAAKTVPPSPYSASKYAASCYARMFHEVYQLPVVIGRVFMVYGPAQRDMKKLIPYTISSLLDGEVPKLGSGWRPFDWIYVDDVVDALIRMTQSADFHGQTVEIGTGKLHTAKEAVETIVDLIGTSLRPEYGLVADRKLEVTRSANVLATENVLSWSAGVTLRDGLARTIEWYRNQRVNLQQLAMLLCCAVQHLEVETLV